MGQFVRLRFATIPMVAAVIIASTTASAWAFSQEMLGPTGGNYNFDYTDPSHPHPDSQSTPSDPNGPGFHFSFEHGQTGLSGFRSDNHFFDNSDKSPAPDYSRPLGN
jgi:hypothetical protein